MALDGTKVQANASVHKAMSYGRMREAENKLAAEVADWFTRAEAKDVEEDGIHGADQRGDEMPAWVANKALRLGASALPKQHWRPKPRSRRHQMTMDRAHPRA